VSNNDILLPSQPFRLFFFQIVASFWAALDWLLFAVVTHKITLHMGKKNKEREREKREREKREREREL